MGSPLPERGEVSYCLCRGGWFSNNSGIRGYPYEAELRYGAGGPAGFHVSFKPAQCDRVMKVVRPGEGY